MRCKECELLIPDFLAGLLSESERKAVLSHKSDCPDCARELDSMQLLFSHRKSTTEHEIVDFRNFVVHVNNKIDNRTHSTARRFLLPALAVPAIAAMLIFVLLNPFEQSESWLEEQNIVLFEELVDQVTTSQLIEFDQQMVLSDDISLEDAGSTAVPVSILDDIDSELSDILLEDFSIVELLAGNSHYLSSDDMLELLSDSDNDAVLAMLTETDFTID